MPEGRLIDSIRKAYEEDPDFNRQEFAARHGCHHRYVRKVVSKIREENGDSPIEPFAARQPYKQNGIKTLTVDELIDKERLDVRRIIRQGISKIPLGQVAYDDMFRRDLGISSERWRLFAREEEFEPYRAILPTRKTVWGQSQTIQDLRQQDGVM